MLKHFVHVACDGCKWLGHYDGFDLYAHGETVIARYGNNPEDCASLDDSISTQDRHLLKARQWRDNGSVEVLQIRRS